MPKSAIDIAIVGWRGIEGDVQETRLHHGLPWQALSLWSADVVDIGEMRWQLTSPAVPCSKIAANFTCPEISLVDHDINPGHSRWYAAVVRPGTITSDDAVTVSPSS